MKGQELSSLESSLHQNEMLEGAYSKCSLNQLIQQTPEDVGHWHILCSQDLVGKTEGLLEAEQYFVLQEPMYQKQESESE